MGAMTASIAHEINQPLAAIAANANAGLRWLSRSTPDIEEVHAALKRINNDAHRASEVIQSVRSIFKKTPQQGAAVDVNDVVLEVLALVHGELINYRILVKSGPASTAPARCRADRRAVAAGDLEPDHECRRGHELACQDRSRVLSVASRTQDPGSVPITVQDIGPWASHPDRRDRTLRRFLFDQSARHGDGPVPLPLDHRTPTAAGCGRPAAEPHGAIFTSSSDRRQRRHLMWRRESERTTRPFRGA